MLIITRKAGERVMIGDDVVVCVMEIVGHQVRIGIEAPKSVPVYREEIWVSIQAGGQAVESDPPAPAAHEPTA